MICPQIARVAGMAGIVTGGVVVAGLLVGASGRPAPGMDTAPVAGLVLEGVRVADPTTGTVGAPVTIEVADGRIVKIHEDGPGEVNAGTERFSGGDSLVVVPGLIDMHVHMFEPGDRWLFLASGVTTVRNLSGAEVHLSFRDSVETGHWPGPRIFTSGPILDGDPPDRATNTPLRSEAEARAAVREGVALGYDFVKIYDNLPLDLYRVVIDEAGKLGVPVVGHVPTPVGLQGLLSNPGQSEIEHAEELLPFFGRDTAGLGDAGRSLAAAGVWLTPTLSVMQSAADQARLGSAILDGYDIEFVGPRYRRWFRWNESVAERAAQPGAAEGFARRASRVREITYGLFREGVRILAGSDTPIPVLVPGRSLHDELEQLQLAGLTRRQALAAATVEPAIFLGHEKELGRVEIGYLADLVLVPGNPFEDLEALRDPVAVVVDGAIFTRADLRARFTAYP